MFFLVFRVLPSLPFGVSARPQSSGFLPQPFDPSRNAHRVPCLRVGSPLVYMVLLLLLVALRAWRHGCGPPQGAGAEDRRHPEVRVSCPLILYLPSSLLAQVILLGGTLAPGARSGLGGCGVVFRGWLATGVVGCSPASFRDVRLVF